MRYIIDSSVAFKWVVPESDSDKAERLRNNFRNGIDELLAPDVFSLELAHALTRAERQGRIPVGQTGVLWADVMIVPPQLYPSGPLTPQAIAISSAERVGVYDCLYVALAEREGGELTTADDRLVRNLQPHFPFIISLASLP